MVGGCHDIKVRQKRRNACHEKLREREALLSQSGHLHALHRVESHIDAAQGNDRLSSAQKALDTFVGPEIAIERKWGSMPHQPDNGCLAAA